MTTHRLSGLNLKTTQRLLSKLGVNHPNLVYVMYRASWMPRASKQATAIASELMVFTLRNVLIGLCFLCEVV